MQLSYITIYGNECELGTQEHMGYVYVMEWTSQ